jgi:hypothetical protein
MSSESPQSHSLSASPRASGSHSENTVHLNRSSSTTTFSVPFFSLASRLADIRSSLVAVSGGGHADGRGGTSTGTARFTVRVTREVEPDTARAQTPEEAARRRGDIALSRGIHRHGSPLRGFDQDGATSGPSSDEDRDPEEETAAASAERHRLTSGTPGIDLQVLTLQ